MQVENKSNKHALKEYACHSNWQALDQDDPMNYEKETAMRECALH